MTTRRVCKEGSWLFRPVCFAAQPDCGTETQPHRQSSQTELGLLGSSEALWFLLWNQQGPRFELVSAFLSGREPTAARSFGIFEIGADFVRTVQSELGPLLEGSGQVVSVLNSHRCCASALILLHGKTQPMTDCCLQTCADCCSVFRC
jgi:hypothetical protein